FPAICAGSATQNGLWSYGEYTITGRRLRAVRRTFDPRAGRFQERESFEMELFPRAPRASAVPRSPEARGETSCESPRLALGSFPYRGPLFAVRSFHVRQAIPSPAPPAQCLRHAGCAGAEAVRLRQPQAVRPAVPVAGGVAPALRGGARLRDQALRRRA